MTRGARSVSAGSGGVIVGVFRDDRALAVVFACLAVAAWAPLFVTPVLPFADLSGNVASAGMLVRALLRDPNALRFYRVDWLPFPYWTTYLLLGTFNLVLGPFLAAKALVGLLVVLLPLALMRLLVALGRDPRLALWGFLVSWERNLYAGWHSYVLAMAIALIVLAKVVEADDERAALRVIPWSVFLALTHAMAVLYVLVAGGLLAWDGRGVWRRLKVNAVALSGSAVMLAPWLVARFRAPVPATRSRSDFHSASLHVAGFFGFTLDNVTGAFAEITSALAFVVLLFGPLALACRRRDEAEGSGQARSGALIVAAGLILYAVLPFAHVGVVDNYCTYPRYASYVLVTLLLVPPVRRLSWLALAPGVIVALACNLATLVALRPFGARMRPFVSIVESVPAGARLLPLEYESRDPVVKFAPLAHLHSYVTAKGAFDPHFFDNVNTPIRYRAEGAIPRIAWLSPREFTLERFAPHYDYILVQGLAPDPLVEKPRAAGYHVTLLREAGIWRLYAVSPD